MAISPTCVAEPIDVRPAERARTRQSNRGANSLLEGVFSNWLGLGLSMAVAFFMSPFLVRSLGDTWYGLWVLIRSTTGYMGLLDGGLRVSIVKYVARHDALSDPEELSRTVSTAFAIYCAVSGVVVVGALILSAVFPSMFNLPASIARTSQVVTIIVGFSVAISLVGAVFGGFVAGLQRYDVANGLGIASLVVRTVAIVGLIWMGYGIISLGLVHLGIQALQTILLAYWCFRLKPDLRISPKYVSKEVGKTLYGYSVFVLFNNLANMMLFRSGEVVAGAFLGAAAVTYYSIAGTLTEYVQRIVITTTMVLHPYSSAKHAKGDEEALRRGVVVSTQLCLLIGLPAAVILVVLGRAFIAAWMGESYATVAAPILVVLSVSRLFSIAQFGTYNILLGVGRHKALAMLNAATGLLSVASGAVLVQYWGLLGMVIGAAVPIALVQGLVLPGYTARALHVPLSDYLVRGVLRPVAGTIPFAAVLVALAGLFHPDSLWEIAAVTLAAAPTFLAGAYFLTFTSSERKGYLSLLPPGLRFGQAGA